ncbi:MAG: DUF2442 domain-containing protein [Candidatus Latescibacterota bacterium]
MKKYHDITELFFENDDMILTVDDRTYKFKLSDISPVLLNSSIETRNKYEISPSGYGIHWPLIDEDLSIDGLLNITHKPYKAPTVS